MTVRKILHGFFVLIVLYLLFTRGQAVNTLLSSLGGLGLKTVATLQGRENITGVTT